VSRASREKLTASRKLQIPRLYAQNADGKAGAHELLLWVRSIVRDRQPSAILVRRRVRIDSCQKAHATWGVPVPGRKA
jgi:hypothetical protein